MKHFARIASAVLAVLMLVACFAACGNAATGSTETKANNDNETNTKTGGTLLIGATGPLTGAYAIYGTSVRNGANLAIAEINEKGVDGTKLPFTLKLDMKDDQGDAEQALNGFNSLYAAGMKTSIGSVTSGACVAFATEAQENGVLVLTPSASDASVIAVGNDIFRVCFGDPQQGEIAAEELTKTYNKIGVIYDTSIDYSSGIFASFDAKMGALGKVSGTDYVVIGLAAETSEYATAIDTLKTAGCDVIFLPIYYEAAGAVAKAAAATNYNVPIFGADGLDGIAGQIDSTVTASISYITPFDVKSTDEKVSAFVSTYRATYSEDPDQFAADGYDAVMILASAMLKAGITDANISATALTEALKTVLTSADFSYTGMTGANMTWDASGSCNKAPMVVEVER